MLAEARQQLLEKQAQYSAETLRVIKASLGFCPMVLGDGKKAGSFMMKYCCPQCRLMPMKDSDWFLVERRKGSKWVCAACMEEYSIHGENMFVGFKTSDEDGDDVKYFRAEAPPQRAQSLLDILKLWTNGCGWQQKFAGALAEVLEVILSLIAQSEAKAALMLKTLKRTVITIKDPAPLIERYTGSKLAASEHGLTMTNADVAGQKSYYVFEGRLHARRRCDRQG